MGPGPCRGRPLPVPAGSERPPPASGPGDMSPGTGLGDFAGPALAPARAPRGILPLEACLNSRGVPSRSPSESSLPISFGALLRAPIHPQQRLASPGPGTDYAGALNRAHAAWQWRIVQHSAVAAQVNRRVDGLCAVVSVFCMFEAC